MNKYEKAFSVLREHANADTVDELIDIKELVEKATHKKPKLNNKYNDQGLYLCPKCNNDLEYDFDYCPNCGQAIKWEEN